MKRLAMIGVMALLFGGFCVPSAKQTLQLTAREHVSQAVFCFQLADRAAAEGQRWTARNA